MKLAILASLLASAAAFSPAKQQARTSSALNADFSKEIGAQAPLGFWDPLKLVKDYDQEQFDRMRGVEVKHGRVAMLAVVGFLTTEAGVRFPGDIWYDGTKFADIPAGHAAFLEMPKGMVAFVLLTIFTLEVGWMRDVTGNAEFPGDFRNGIDFGWDKQSAEWQRKKRAIELNNGRAAQMGILGLMVHEQLGNLDDILVL